MKPFILCALSGIIGLTFCAGVAAASTTIGADIATGGLTLSGSLQLAESVPRSFTLSTRAFITTFPVPSLRPVSSNSVLAFDLMPNGTPTENGSNGYSWLDACDTDLGDVNPGVTCGRIGARSDAIEVGSRTFNGGVVKPLYFTINDGTPKMVISTTGMVGIGTSTPATRLQVSSGASATTTVTIGELGLSSSKACVNMNQANGSPGSFYISGGAMVVESNYCR